MGVGATGDGVGATGDGVGATGAGVGFVGEATGDNVGVGSFSTYSVIHASFLETRKLLRVTELKLRLLLPFDGYMILPVEPIN